MYPSLAYVPAGRPLTNSRIKSRHKRVAKNLRLYCLRLTYLHSVTVTLVMSRLTDPYERTELVAHSVLATEAAFKH